MTRRSRIPEGCHPRGRTEDNAGAAGQAGRRQQLLSKTQGELQQRVQASRGQILQDIAKVAGEVARRKGGTLVYDRGSLVYSDRRTRSPMK